MQAASDMTNPVRLSFLPQGVLLAVAVGRPLAIKAVSSPGLIA